MPSLPETAPPDASRASLRDQALVDLYERTNWGRWGPDDQRGTLNLVSADRVLAAASSVRVGKSISLSRDFPTKPAVDNVRPAQHFLQSRSKGVDGGAAVDYYGIDYHGLAATHIDALAHVWGRDGAWNGRSGAEIVTPEGVTWGGIEQWSDGVVTRGWLLDVPRHRGDPCVSLERPVTSSELEAIVSDAKMDISPGDAIAIYSGRERWDETHTPWGTRSEPTRPGLHPSCLSFLRQTDCSVLIWDMMDAVPNGLGLTWSVHGAIFALGLALVDNAALRPLAEECQERSRSDFLFVAAPLKVIGGTGSPINPLAVL